MKEVTRAGKGDLIFPGDDMVLFLFMVMMLDINLTPLRDGFARFLPVGGAVAFLMFTAMVPAVGPRHFGADRVAEAVQHPPGYSNTRELGRVPYTDYLYPFEIAAVILLVAIVAAIALTLRLKRQTTQKPEEQVAVRRTDRVRLVKMTPDERQ